MTTDNTMPKLRECPFCGGENVRFSPPPRGLDTDRLYPIVRCQDCYAEAVGKDDDYKGATAITAWNTRAPPAIADKLAEALRGVLNRGLEREIDTGIGPQIEPTEEYYKAEQALVEYAALKEGK